MLIAASIRGPLSPLSKSVKVDHVLPGARVELAVNGAPIGKGADALNTSVTVPLGGDQLPPNGLVTARWTLAAESSPDSIPEAVLPWPDLPPTPYFTSYIHVLADWMRVEGLYPGASVQITGPNGAMAGPITADTATEYLDLTGGYIAVDDIFQVVQKVNVPGKGNLSSKAGKSLRAASTVDVTGRDDREIPSPTIMEPTPQCAQTIRVGGAIEGCWTILRTDQGTSSYRSTHDVFRLKLSGEAHAPATYSVSTKLTRAGLTSGTSTTVAVDPAQALPQPRILTTIPYNSCLSTVTLDLADLTEGSELTFVVRTNEGTTVIGRSAAPDDSTTGTYPLGDLTAYKHGMLSVVQHTCQKSLQSNEILLSFADDDRTTPPAFFLQPQRCARWLHVNNVDPMTYLTVHSDLADWPILAAWTRPDENGWVPLNRELRPGETVWVSIDAGCRAPGARQSESAKVQDKDWGGLELDPYPRPGLNRSVDFAPDGAVLGVRTHAFVNQKWRNTTWLLPWPTGLASIFVGALKDGDVVTVRQSVCTDDRDLQAHADVRQGRMTLHSSPDTATRGETMQLLVWGEDADSGRQLPSLPVDGLPPIAERPPLVLTNPAYTVPWPFTPNASTPSPIHLTVDWEGYDQGVLDIPVSDPVVPPAPTANFHIHTECLLGFLYGNNQIITNIQWTLIGAGVQLPWPAAKPNSQKCDLNIDLPMPPKGGVVYNLGGEADITADFAGTRTTRKVRAFVTAFGQSDYIQVHWMGKPLTYDVNIAILQSNDGSAVPVFVLVSRVVD
jgi:hypothetical protein